MNIYALFMCYVLTSGETHCAMQTGEVFESAQECGREQDKMNELYKSRTVWFECKSKHWEVWR